MNQETISTLDSSTFVVSSANGDIEAKPDHLMVCSSRTTHHLSVLTLNAQRLDLLSTDEVECYFIQFFCVAPSIHFFQIGSALSRF